MKYLINEHYYYDDKITPAYSHPSILNASETISVPIMKLCPHCCRAKTLDRFDISKTRKCGYARCCNDGCAAKRKHTFTKRNSDFNFQSHKLVRAQSYKLLRQGIISVPYECIACACGYDGGNPISEVINGNISLDLHHELYIASAVIYLCPRHHKQLESKTGKGKMAIQFWPIIKNHPSIKTCWQALQEIPEPLWYLYQGRSAQKQNSFTEAVEEDSELLFYSR